MQTVTIGKNALDSSTWTTHQVEDLSQFLPEKLGRPFPRTCRVYADSVDVQHDITPINEEGVEAILRETRHLYFVIYPEGASILVPLAIQGALFLAGYLIQKFRDKPNPGRPVRAASPNNAIGERQNTARLLGRIPDNYGELRMTPDLLSSSITLYDSQNREVEQSAMCLGRGEYFIPSTLGIYEGDNPAETVLGLSVEVYPPGQVPGHGGTPQLTIGSPIGAPIWNVYKVDAVNGQLLLGYNHFTIHGTQIVDTTYLQDNSQTPTPGSPPNPVFFPFALVGYDYPSTGVGRIYIPTTAGNAIDPQYNIVTDSIEIGDVLELRMAKETYSDLGQQFLPEHGSSGYVIFDPGSVNVGPGGSLVSSFPSLSDNNLGYTVTNITTTVLAQPLSAPAVGVNYVVVEVAVPSALQANWAALAGLASGAIVFNDAALITPKFRTGGFAKNLIGPIFVNDPNMQFLVCNFVAQDGLYIDDGKNPAAINVGVTVFLTPADAFGTAIGPTESQNFTVSGSSYSADTRALTAIVTPSTFAGGRCLISCQRTTLEQWRVDDPGYRIQRLTGPAVVVLRGAEDPFGDHAYPASDWTAVGTYKPTSGQVQEQLRWTHCYSLSDPGITDYGDVTLVMAQQVANTSSKVVSSRKLSIQGIRKTFAWDGVTFGGFLSANINFPENMLFSILKDPALGNLPDDNIDFAGIQAAFDTVRSYFNTNTQVLNFGYSFDVESQTLEDMIVQLCQSCFITPYRDGSVIRAKPDISTLNSVLLLNHRNVIPGSETREVSFSTEANYDGVKVDWADDSTNTIQTLTIPSFSLKPREIQIVGIRDPVRAGIHAYRAYNHLLYQNVSIELDALAEAAIAVNNDRILIADSTRPDTQDGEVIAVSGLNLTTSQPVTLGSATATIFIQHPDGTVEGIPVTQSANSTWVFDGIDDQVAFGNVLDMLRTTARSMFAWYSTTTIGRAIVGKQNGASTNGWRWTLSTSRTQDLILSNSGGTQQIQAGCTVQPPADGSEHHFGWTYDGSSSATGVNFYLDNVLQAKSIGTNNLTSGSTSNTEPLQIGDRGTTAPWSGTLRHISIWNRVLTAGEVSQLYNVGSPPDLSTLSFFASACVLWVKMDGTDSTSTGGIIDHSPSGLNGTALNGLTKSGSGSIPGSNTVALQFAPSLPIQTDSQTGVRTGYQIINDANTRERAFQLVSKDMQSSQTWKIQASNYAHGYYFVDGLHYWLYPHFTFTQDTSPYSRVTANVGITLINDPHGVRGLVATDAGGPGHGLTISENPSTTMPILPFNSYDDYTKAAWVYLDALGTQLNIISNSFSNRELFIITSAGNIQVWENGGTAIDVPGFPTGSWHHLVVTRSSATGVARLYLDTVEIGHATGLTSITSRSTTLNVMGTAVAWMDDVRLYARALAFEEIVELYNRTKM